MRSLKHIGLLLGVAVLILGAVLLWWTRRGPVYVDLPAPASTRPDSRPAPSPVDTAVVEPSAVDTAAVQGDDSLHQGDEPLRSREPDAAFDALDLVIPVRGVQPGDLTDTFTEARSQGRVHNAIDIIAPQHTPVLAAADGRIVRLFHSDKGGVTIYQLAPDNRTVYYYAHLDRYAEGLAQDQEVRQGDVIGYVGDTGNAVPGNYHLHFAIWITDDPAAFWDGEAINPYPLLRGAAS